MKQAEKFITENDFNGKIAKLREKLPGVFKGIVKSVHADTLFGGLNDFKILELSNKKKLVFLNTPGHGYFFDMNGEYVGEEDGGLEGALQKYNNELQALLLGKSA